MNDVINDRMNVSEFVISPTNYDKISASSQSLRVFAYYNLTAIFGSVYIL